MRYVIAVCLLTGFIVWDVASNDSRVLNYTVKEVKRVTSLVGA